MNNPGRAAAVADITIKPLAHARGATHLRVAFILMLAFFALAPTFIYPVFLMKVMCFALFACAFNLLLGYVGLLSFGHAMFLGIAGYAAAYVAKEGLNIEAFRLGSIHIPLNIALPPFTPELAILTGVLAAAI